MQVERREQAEEADWVIRRKTGGVRDREEDMNRRMNREEE